MTEIVQKNVCGSYKEVDEWEGCSIDDFVIPNGEVFMASAEEMHRMSEELSHIYERIDMDAAIAEIESRNIVLTD
jgi:hypothetical protein